MKWFLSFMLAFSPIIEAEAQGVGPGPNPYGVFEPFNNGIAYEHCMALPMAVTGGCEGDGSINVSSLYVNGVQINQSLIAYLSNPAGSAGGLVAYGGDAGTPSSITLTNGTGLSILTGTTGILSVSRGGTGASSFTAGLPLFGNGTNAFSLGSLSGNTTKLGTVSGSIISGHCLQADSNGNIIDAGGVCTTGGGGGTVTSGTAGNLAYYSSTGTAVTGLSNGTSSQILIGGSTPSWGSVNLSTMVSGILQAAQSPAYTGDVTSSSGSLSLTIASGAVTNAKLAAGAAAANLGGMPLFASSNLSDLGSPSTARTNLGLGSLATSSTVNLTNQASGTLQAPNFPALTGDATTTAGSLITAVNKIGGKSVTLGGALTTTGAFSLGLTVSANTSLTLPTSGTVTALGNAVTGSGSIVLATSPTLTTPNLGTPSNLVLTNATGLPISSLTGLGSGVGTALAASPTGSGSLVLSSSPSISSLTVTGAFNATGLVTNADLANSSTTVNGVSCALGASCAITATSASMTVGTTTIVGGTSGYALYNNAGTLGNIALGPLATASTLNLSSQASGTLQAAQFPALSGVVTTVAGGLTTSITSGSITSSMLSGTAVTGSLGYTPLNPANNLSDLGSAPSARSNLGLGSLATASSVNLSSQATGTLLAAQFPALTGAITNTAGNLTTTISAGAVTSSMLASGAITGSLGYTPLSTANNLSDLSSASSARSNLGLGSLATLSAAPAGTLTGTALSSGVTSSSLTSVGTLTSLNISGAETISGSAGASFYLNVPSSTYQGNIFFQTAGVSKWQIGKQSGDTSLYFYNDTLSDYALTFNTSDNSAAFKAASGGGYTFSINGYQTALLSASGFYGSSTTANAFQISALNASSGASGPFFILDKSRSAASVSVGDSLGTLLWQGYDSSNINVSSSQIAALVTAVGSTSVDSALNYSSYGPTGSHNFTVNGTTVETLNTSGASFPLGISNLTVTGYLTATGLITTSNLAANAVTNAKLASGSAAANLGFTPLNPSSNLSDLTSASTARTNLGLGSLATLTPTTPYTTVGVDNTGAAYNVPRRVEATDFMTQSQINDGVLRVDSIDVSSAINSCVQTGLIRQASCHIPNGKWKVSGAQIVQQGSYSITAVSGTSSPYTFTAPGIPVIPVGTTMLVQAALPSTLNGVYTVTASSSGSITLSGSGTGTWTSNGGVAFPTAITVEGDGPTETVLDGTANSASPFIIFKAPGGTSTSNQVSMTYGGIRRMNIQGNLAGTAFQDGLDTFYDAWNQQDFQDLSIQNFNSSSASTCGRFNAVYSPSAISVNCSTAAGPAGGNDLWQFRSVSFGFFASLGGSNGNTYLHISAGTNAGNAFVSIDCEVVKICIGSDSGANYDNSFYGGTWSWNWNSSGNSAVYQTAGTDLGVFFPNQNPYTGSGAAGAFIDPAALTSALYNYSTISRIGIPASSQATTANPSGLSSAGMAGLGASCSITPKTSGRVMFQFVGNYTNSGGNFTSVITKYGTGSAPANAASVTGTSIGPSSTENGTSLYGFSSGGIATGLTAGTTYWFDLAVTPTGGTGTLTNIGCSAAEL